MAMNYELTKHYFKVVDDHMNETISYKPSLIAAVIGLLLMFVVKKTAAVIIGILLIALGVFLIVNQKKRIQREKDRIQAEKDAIPTDEMYDGEVMKALNDLRRKAFAKLGIDEDEVKEIEPISFDGYV